MIYLIIRCNSNTCVNAAHVTINIPYKNGNNNYPKTIIAVVVAGVAPNVEPAYLQYIEQLSYPEDNCLYHADIPQDENRDVTDIAILNSCRQTVEFKSENFATISITEVSY